MARFWNLSWVAALVCALCAGCRTGEVNPRAAGKATGYVDFYTRTNEDLSWEVKREDSAGKMQVVFCKYSVLRGNILRLPTPAGAHRFSVWFNNRVTSGPETVLVQVINSQVTPVEVSFASAGETAVQSQSYEYRPTAHATRRVTRISQELQPAADIVLVAAPAQAYQPKERMPYFSLPAQPGR